MCGRLVIDLSPEMITEIYGIVRKIERELNPRYNVTPSQTIPIVREDAEGNRELAIVRWGLIPSWAKDIAIGNSLINARSETAAEKPSFRSAFKRRRCIIPTGGFYEWQRQDGKRKQPWYFRMADGSPVSIAGLWEHWQGSDGQVIESCSILTTSANELMAPIHERMPVILNHEDDETWLNSKLTDVAVLQEFCRPYSSEMLSA
ncbi:MAG: SOS response-associated peptidase [Desulfuromonadaceae bacterium]|jgi:putative SOS response-associated peptidase YedK|nr:SOS response-associated peptidase [Desulfuromonadaceae bacterium]MDD2847350.1 SOS response-associated peptidase [Desulfuromonadaceae bacterium]